LPEETHTVMDDFNPYSYHSAADFDDDWIDEAYLSNFAEADPEPRVDHFADDDSAEIYHFSWQEFLADPDRYWDDAWRDPEDF
jgi:hypothetical protein